MARLFITGSGPRVPVNAGDGVVLTNRGPGTLSYAISDSAAAAGTVTSGNAINTEGTLYLFASASCTVDVDGPPDGAVNRVRMPNATITFEANTVVDATQLGDDGPAPLREQHLSTSDATTTGTGAPMTVNPGAAFGLNQDGAALRLAGGASTGTGGGGSVTVLTTPVGSSGSVQNNQTDSWYFWGGNLEKAITPATDNAQDIGYDTLRIRRFKIGQYVELTEMAAPAAPAANIGRLFVRDNGSGKTQLCVIFPTGAPQVLSTEP